MMKILVCGRRIWTKSLKEVDGSRCVLDSTWGGSIDWVDVAHCPVFSGVGEGSR